VKRNEIIAERQKEVEAARAAAAAIRNPPPRNHQDPNFRVMHVYPDRGPFQDFILNMNMNDVMRNNPNGGGIRIPEFRLQEMRATDFFGAAPGPVRAGMQWTNNPAGPAGQPGPQPWRMAEDLTRAQNIVNFGRRASRRAAPMPGNPGADQGPPPTGRRTRASGQVTVSVAPPPPAHIPMPAYMPMDVLTVD